MNHESITLKKWICLISLFTVGLSLALPFFLFFRHSYIIVKIKYKLENKHVPAKISKMFIQAAGARIEQQWTNSVVHC
jgi:Terpene cyclase DEP1